MSSRSRPPTAAQDDDPVAACTREALRLMHENLGPHGFLAAAPGAGAHSRGYDRVFGRDAAICAIAAARSGDARLAAGARRSLRTLAAHQAKNGQIPKYVDPETQSADFWYLGCIDATLWWLIAVRRVAQHLGEPAFEQRLKRCIERALDWLSCQEHQQIHLLQQNEASDWADIMPRSGFVLYSNALWHLVKRLYRLPHAEDTRHHFNFLFHPYSGRLPEYRRLRLLMHYVRNRTRNRDLYLSFVNLGQWGDEGDVFGNLLALLCGLADDHRANRILRAVERNQAGAAHPVRVTCTPIARDNPLWRTYMGRHRQNMEYRYHNGGIWPFVGGFWVMALAAAGKDRLAAAELEKLARANAAGQWEFNEWFNGESGRAEGMPRQTWNAATFLLARQGMQDGVFI